MIPEREVFVCVNLTRAAVRTEEQVRHLYRERQLMVRRWHRDGATFQEIADALGVSRSRGESAATDHEQG